MRTYPFEEVVFVCLLMYCLFVYVFVRFFLGYSFSLLVLFVFFLFSGVVQGEANRISSHFGERTKRGPVYVTMLVPVAHVSF